MKFFKKRNIAIIIALLVFFGIGAGILWFLFTTNEETEYIPSEIIIKLPHPCIKVAKDANDNCTRFGDETTKTCIKNLKLEEEFRNCTSSADKTILIGGELLNCTTLESKITQNCTILGNGAEQNCELLFDNDIKHCKKVVSCIKTGDEEIGKCRRKEIEFINNCANQHNETISNCTISFALNETSFTFTPEDRMLINSNSINETNVNCTSLKHKIIQNCTISRNGYLRNCIQTEDEKTDRCIEFEKKLKNCEDVRSKEHKKCAKLADKSKKDCIKYRNVEKKNCTDYSNETVWNCTVLEYGIIENCTIMSSENLTSCTGIANDKADQCINLETNLKKCKEARIEEIKKCSESADESKKGCDEDGNVKIQNCTNSNQTVWECETLKHEVQENCTTLRYENMTKCTKIADENHTNCRNSAYGIEPTPKTVREQFCYYDIHDFTSKWCGEELTYHEQKENLTTTNPSTDDLCLDLVTPLAIQPKCETNETKADCEEEGGECYEERCCPKLKKRGTDQFAVYDFPFKTNVSCHPDGTLPLIFSFAFCNPSDGKVWTIGLKDKAGALVRSNLRFCANNTDCEKEFVCVNLIQGRRMCYFDPAYEFGLDWTAAAIYFFPLFFVLVALSTCLWFAVYKL